MGPSSQRCRNVKAGNGKQKAVFPDWQRAHAGSSPEKVAVVPCGRQWLDAKCALGFRYAPVPTPKVSQVLCVSCWLSVRLSGQQFTKSSPHALTRGKGEDRK